MENSKEIVLDSGSKLKITIAEFEIGRNLYQAVLEEARQIQVKPSDDLDLNTLKELFCIGLASKRIESALWACMPRVTYNGVKVTKDTFEPVEARGDYVQVCYEVAKENVLPFGKSLFAKFSVALAPLLAALK